MQKKQQMPRRVDAAVYRFWQALYMAFYSKRLYVDVAKRWRGLCFFYLLWVIAVAAIPISVRLVVKFNHYVDDQIIAPLNKIPPLEVHNGEISFDKPMPWLVTNNTGAVIAMIDTRTYGKGMDGTWPELMMLVTKDKFYFRPPKIRLLSDAAPDSKARNNVIEKMPDKDTSEILRVGEWAKSSGLLNLKWLVAGMIYPCLVSFLFSFFFVFFLVLSMLAQVFSWLVLRFKLTFKQAARLMIVTSTVQFLVLLLLPAVNVSINGLWFLCLASFVCYFCYAVLSVKRESLRLVRT